MYTKIRNAILKRKILFLIIHICYTPIRWLRECIARRKITNDVLSKYHNMDPMRKNVFYFGIPEHNNLGDIAQTYCTLKWIEENYFQYNIIKIRTRAAFDGKLIKFIKAIWRSEDLIICQSGYCTRYKNTDHLMHKRLAKIFSDKQIVILPQTVKLKNKKDIYQTKQIFEKCEHLLFICRDKISFESAKNFARKDQVVCFPDIVTSLIGRLNIDDANSRKGVLICVRNDDEKYYTDNEIAVLRDTLKKEFEIVDIRDTNSNYGVQYTYDHLDNVIREIVSDFAKYKVIITDRYHGTIFSLIANTPVVVVKTNDHKVTSGVDWFDGVFEKNSVQLATELNKAASIAYEISVNDHRITNSDFMYQTYYKDKLMLEIKSH